MLSRRFIVFSVIGLVAFYSVSFAIFSFLDSKDVYSKYDEIYYDEVMSQGGDYFVYFYQDDCSDCMSIEEDVGNSFTEEELYLVDVSKFKNRDCWYDWEKHHEMYDVKIGEVVNGEKIYYAETEEEFLAQEHFDEFGNKIEYSIASGKEYLQTNPTADINGIYAVNNTPLLSLESQQVEIRIARTPTVIEVNDGEVVGYYHGSESVKKLMESRG